MSKATKKKDFYAGLGFGAGQVNTAPPAKLQPVTLESNQLRFSSNVR
jgi:hypothetical protein